MSIVYLISLWLSLPVWAILIGMSAVSLGLWKLIPAYPEFELTATRSERVWTAVLLIIGLAIIIYKAYSVEEKAGHWDAWWFWNMRANYLARPEHWRLAFSGNQYGTPFTVPVAHSDYPPFLPLITGFCWRLLSMQPAVLPFVWSMLALLLIPAVLFIELFPRNKVVAITALFFFTTQDYIIKLGTSQTADVWIALFLLLACISYHAFNVTRDKACILFLGAALGCCLWAKNEGVLLTGVFMAFTIPAIIRQRCLNKFIQGIAVPLLALVFFKMALAPPNDIIAAQDESIWVKISDLSRYRDVRRLTWDMVELYFPALPYLLAGYFIFCILEKKRPDRTIWIVLLGFMAYLSVYIVTPHNIGWHINTSVDRLVFHLFPALLWIISLRLTRVRFELGS